MLLKAGVEIFKILNKIGIKPKDVIGMGGDIVKMGKSLFNTRVNPKLLEFIAKNDKIPAQILENIKLHARTLKNATENQKNLFLENLKSISKAKSPVKLKEAEIIKFPVKSQSPVSSAKKQATIDWYKKAADKRRYSDDFYKETPGKFVRTQTQGTKENLLNDLKNAYPKHYTRLTGKETAADLKEMLFRLDTEGIPFTHGGIANHFRVR